MWSVRLVAALLCASATHNVAFAQSPVPNLSSAEFPWVLINPINPEYLPPSSGLGPVTYDKARPHIARLLNNVGNVVERPLPLADLSNPNLKPWVVDFLRKSNDLMLAGTLCGVEMGLRLAGVPIEPGLQAALDVLERDPVLA